LAENPKKLRKELKKQGAELTGSIKQQISFVAKLVAVLGSAWFTEDTKWGKPGTGTSTNGR
jgi:hypothetical protein